MYEMCKIIESNGKDRAKDVPYPIYPLNMFTICNNLYTKWYSFGEIIHTFSLDQGGRFIGNNMNIPDHLVSPVVDLFASVVRYDNNKRRYTHFNSPVFLQTNP